MEQDLNIKKLDVSKNDIIASPQKDQSSNTNMARKKQRRIIRFIKSRKGKVLIAVLGLFIVMTAFLGVKAYAIYQDAQRVYAQSKVAVAAAKQQNIIATKDELVKTQKEVAVLKKDIDSLFLIGYIPFFGGYYNDGRHLVNASGHGINAAIIASDSLIPYADVLGLKGEGSFVAGSAQDRIRLAVKSLGKVVPKIDEIEKEVKLAQAEVDQVDPNRYPDFWKFSQVRAQIQQVKDITAQGVSAVEEGKPLIKVLPELLGESEPKYYLFLFQNDKELRPTGGFLTFYSIFKVEEGVVSVETSSDIYNLDDSISSHPAAHPIIADYLPKVNRWYIRDSNLSPDFKVSMDQFNEFYEESSQFREVDGIIALDTHFLVSVLEILGEVEAGGLKFNADNDERCDCPQAVYVLEDNTTRPVNYIKTNRKGLLGELLFAIMNKALSSSPKEYWGRLVQAGISDAQDKHVMFYLYDEGAQQGIEALNWGGRIRDFEGDYMHINDANFGGAKSNLFVRNDVRVDYDVKDGKISKKVTLNYKNQYKHSDCNLERGGLCLNARLRNFQRVYVPKGTSLINSKGSQVKVKTQEEFGKSYFESFFYVDPLGKAAMSYEYQLPFEVPEGNELPVYIQKQPGTYDTPYEIYVNGKLAEKFDLKSDTQLMLKI